MIIPSGGVEKALGAQIQKIYKTNHSDTVSRTTVQDLASISAAGKLVDIGKAAALKLPSVREDKVQAAREMIANGTLPSAEDIAGNIIDHLTEGR